MGRERRGPAIYDINTLLQAGIDPKTRLPLKLGSFTQADKQLKFNARRLFRIMDEQRHCNQFRWYGLPEGLDSQLVERLLYYKYSLVFFYFKEVGQFFLMPYALDGTIDFYGRFNTVHPVPMTSGAEKEEQSKEYKQKSALLSQLKLNVVKDVIVDKEEITEELLTKSGVILRDYTNQIGQLGEPRYLLNDHLLEMEAECLPFLRTNLLISSGIQAIRVPDADAAEEVNAVAKQIYNAAMNGNPYVAITDPVEFQELQPGSLQKSSEYFLSLQSIDNLLLATHGIDNSGVYEKKSHILESENQVNYSVASYVKNDKLEQRRHFCDIVNSIWGTAIYVEEVQIAEAMEQTSYDEGESQEEDPQDKEQEGDIE